MWKDGLRAAWILKLMGEPATEPASFGEYFLTCGLAEGEQHFLVLERVQESDVLLMIDNNDGEDGP